jgi:hypothetical protein
VTPATWQQVHDDNLTAGARRNALRVKVGDDAGTRTYWVHASRRWSSSRRIATGCAGP